MTVVRVDADRWEAFRGTERLGALGALRRPDQRTVLSFRECHADAYALLAAAGNLDLRRPAPAR
jgi:hypothetical protein